MKVTESQELLADYVKHGSEKAFRELVARYLDLVYSTALRSVGGDTHRAEDVAQTVFLDLARLASRLSKEVLLGGWLHRHTCYVASTFLRTERRRQDRERQAVEMSALEDRPGSDLAQLAPVLDAAINELDEEDRKAILLRFYEHCDLRSVGLALGSSENAAQKRVSRALEQLHSILVHRGVTLSLAALTAMLAGEAVTAAPAGLAVTIVSTALAGAAAGAGVSVTLFKLSALAKAKLAFIAALAAGSIATTLWLQHQSHEQLLRENELLRQQLAQTAAPAPAQRPPAEPAQFNGARPAPRRPFRPAPPSIREQTVSTAPPVVLAAAADVHAAPALPGAVFYAAEAQHIRLFAKSGSKIRIEGTSNIHDWQVEGSLIGGFVEVGPGFPIEPGQPVRRGKLDARAEPFVMVQSLKSVDKDGRPYSDRMDQDLYERLKAQENPRISFDLAELTLQESARDKEHPYLCEAKGLLVLAGVTNPIAMSVNLLPSKGGRMKISGSLKLKMSDFEIEPPSMSISLGMIKVADEIKLNFEWMVGTNSISSAPHH